MNTIPSVLAVRPGRRKVRCANLNSARATRSGRVLAVALVCFYSQSASAVDVTANYLEAPKANVCLILERQNDALGFDVDVPGKIPRITKDQQTVLFAREVNVVYDAFNPFKVAIKIDAEEADDPNFVQLKAFLEALAKLPDAVKAQASAAPSFDKAASTVKSRALSRDKSKAARFKEGILTGQCDPLLEKFDKALIRTICLMKGDTGISEDTDGCPKPRDWATDIRAWADSSDTPARITSNRTEVLATLNDLDINVAALAAELVRLEAAAGELGELGKQTNCGAASHVELADSLTVSLLAASNLQHKRNLRDALAGIAATLERPSNPANWTREERPLYIVYRHSALQNKQLSLKVAVTPLLVSESKDRELKIEQKTPIQASFVARGFSRFVPEVAAGIIHSGVKRPKYGTAQKNGQTIVASAGDETAKYGATLLLNVVCRCWGASIVHPAFQFGVSTDKEVPALLAGVGLRFTRPLPFSIAGGVVALAWVRDLDKLKPGDPINGTADIENDLHLVRAPAKGYVGLQVSF